MRFFPQTDQGAFPQLDDELRQKFSSSGTIQLLLSRAQVAFTSCFPTRPHSSIFFTATKYTSTVLGQEPWLNYLMRIKFTEGSGPIVESNRLLQACQ